MEIIDKTSSIFFATFSRYGKGKRQPTNGMVDPVLSFLLPKVRSLVLLDTPHLVSDSIEPIIEVYNDQRLSSRFILSKFWYFLIYLFCTRPSTSETRISYKVRDFISVLLVAFTQKGSYDVFIGLESVFALAGIVLKKLGKVKTVVYYVSDYAPNRYKNKAFNALYLLLDRFCLRHCDYTWDVSPAMQKGRIQAGLPNAGIYRVIHVPNGLFPSQIASLPIAKRDKNDLVYMGILQSDMGPDLAIKAFGVVLKIYPKMKLHIIGGSQKDSRIYKAMAKRLRLEKSILFHGFIQDNTEMAKIVRRCYIGLAPYRAFPDSWRWFGDAGKIRQYTAAGLPVVTTQVPPLGRFIVSQGAGIMTTDTVKSFSNGILLLLSDFALYKKLSRGAQKVSKDNTWEHVYSKALSDMKAMRSTI